MVLVKLKVKHSELGNEPQELIKFIKTYTVNNNLKNSATIPRNNLNINVNIKQRNKIKMVTITSITKKEECQLESNNCNAVY